jgi:hypothetical protein
VIRLCDLLVGKRVQSPSDLLRLRAVVDENERRARVSDLVEHQRDDSSPHRAVDMCEVIHGRNDSRLHAFHESTVDDLYWPEARLCFGSRSVASGKEARDLIQRLLCCRETNALRNVGGEAGEALQREREMGSALCARDGVNLVHDHGAKGAEHRATAHTGEQDVQRLGRRDEDMRRFAQHLRAR